ncbi:hypothetical protein BCON_0517g00030 [Botryotinia convoluta]|uniref:Uncharacterized protein n=1 Tax=Botryotinia convoluta TaxID=54673 RepID=A0A4Z1H6K5_9HELO|nr:hypothetical protein BCON_0517g00030 [Botryotinia convoluta]
MQEAWRGVVFSTQDAVTKQYNLASLAAMALSFVNHDWLGITVLRRLNNKDISEGALSFELMRISGVSAQIAGVTYNKSRMKLWLFWKERLEALEEDLDENTRVWAKNTVEYMSDFDSMLGHGITKGNKTGGDNRENAENLNPNKGNEISSGDSEDINENFYDTHCRGSLSRSASLCLKKKLQLAMNDPSMASLFRRYIV